MEQNIIIGLGVFSILCLGYAIMLFPHRLGVPIYWVHHGEAAVLYPFGAKERVDTTPGIKFKGPLTYVDKWRINNDYLLFPSAEGSTMTLYTSDRTGHDTFEVQFMIPFKRTDLLKWAIDNVSPQQQFKLYVESTLSAAVKSESFENTFYKPLEMQKKIDTALKDSSLETQFGVSFLPVKTIRLLKLKENKAVVEVVENG